MPGKEFPGQKGFPTPDDTPLTEGYLLFKFPDSNDWAGVLLGAAQALTYEWNWYNWGEMLPFEAADAWKDIVNQAPYNLVERGAPTPYWDTDDDVDDELPADEQPWYGYVEDPEAPPDELTFVEQFGIWGITGFLAFATWEVGFAPAIIFNSIAPKFVLAFKRGDVGEVIRIIVDANEAAMVDTSAAAPGDVLRVPIIAGDDETSRQITIIQVT